MARYRLRPIEVDGQQFERGMEDGIDFREDLPEGCCPIAHYVHGDPHDTEIYPYINTIIGKIYVAPDDYVISVTVAETGQVNRMAYPVDAFHAIYAPVGEEWILNGG